MQRKYIVVTGGVLSGLGKGVAIASIGNLISSTYKVVPIKCDGYLNTDPGTMNPVEHGEVFVLDDGGEVDMDFGHYERFLNTTCKFHWNLTMGKVFDGIRQKERRGDYLGKTVQMIPHVSDFIVDHFLKVGEESEADVVLIEIGGTIGDMENELYLEAARSLKRKVGIENMVFIHLGYVPVPNGVNEQKSKPTQQSISMLRQRGIAPDIIIARCQEMLTDNVCEKIANFANLRKEDVITGVDVDDIYKIPLVFEEQGMSELLSEKLGFFVSPDLREWKEAVYKREKYQREITVAIAGKYTALEDSYASVMEALNHCASYFSVKINLKWIDTEEENIDMTGIDGVIVPGGFGSRGIEGKINVIKYCRENNVPFLGICYGLQMAVIEFCRNVCGLSDANSTEVNMETSDPVVDILESQKDIENLGGTMRLGAYPARILEGSKVYSLYDDLEVFERHRHRYEVNPMYHQMLRDKGMVISGMSPDGTLAEFIEISNHRFFVATQAHPELKSNPLRPAPLFRGFVKACLD
ncbi:MAG: CTP synthase (glutamine hydrolyzing) [Nanoarchaeota archaeon]|jgi:CTP synthase|nr:CTP synthase (glutamine hydrolyzing) [Nanoarchaeota archaeon]